MNSGGAGIVEWLLTGLRTAMSNFADRMSGTFISFVLPLAASGLTIYLLITGIQIAQGRIQAPLQEIVWRMLRLASIAAILVASGAYAFYVVGALEGLRDGLVATITGGPPADNAIDLIAGDLMALGNEYADQASQSLLINVEVWIIAALYWAAKLVLQVFSALPLAISYTWFYLSISIGPLFIACLLFPVTARYFEAWLGTTLVAVMTHVAVALVIAASSSFFSQLAQLAQQKKGAVNPLSLALDVFIATLLLAYMAWKAGDLAAQWVGGTSVFNPMDRGFFTGPASAATAAARGGAHSAAKAVGRLFTNRISRH